MGDTMLSLSKVGSRNILTAQEATPEFMDLQLRYLHRILPAGEYETKEVTGHEAFMCRGNFYKLLVRLNIPSSCFWLTLHLNGMTNPSEFTGEVNGGGIVIVKPEFVKGLLRKYTAKLNSN